MNYPGHSSLVRCLLFAAATCAPAVTASAADPIPDTTIKTEQDVVELSPFEVDASDDKGYRATNAISGTRLDTKVQKIPMPLEVITAEFIRDTGANDLRDSLRFSAGVQIENQNDFGAYEQGGFQNPGGVNNPTGKTADKSDSNFVMRGFLTENVLRDGFRRRVTTDSVDVGRIEVVRGPAVLLYGTGNFGGVVNYIPKSPGNAPRQEVELTAGSYDFYRFTADSTGPIVRGGEGGKGELHYRLNFAYQGSGDHTEYYDNKKIFIAPVVTWRPWANTELKLDTQYGRRREEGIGFQSLRARADISSNEVNPQNTGQQACYERAAFIRFPDQSLRTMRWSGPDTRQESRAHNIEVKLTQKIAENLHLQAGFNTSLATFDTRDIAATATNGVGPSSLWTTLDPEPLDAGIGDSEVGGWYLRPVASSIVQYRWQDTYESTRSNQSRVELNYKLPLWEDRKWLRMSNSFTAGFSSQQDTILRNFSSVDRDETGTAFWNYKSVADSTPFRFGVQRDGTPDQPIRLLSDSRNKPRNEGVYGIYFGEFLDGKVTLLGGICEDRSRLTTGSTSYSYATGDVIQEIASSTPEAKIRTKSDTSTYQWVGFIIPGAQGSDYPKDSWSVFTNYKFDRLDKLKGLVSVGERLWERGAYCNTIS